MPRVGLRFGKELNSYPVFKIRSALPRETLNTRFAARWYRWASLAPAMESRN